MAVNRPQILLKEANKMANEINVMENEMEANEMEAKEMELKESLVQKGMQLLQNYDVRCTKEAVTKIINKWWDAKANLREILRKHVMWNEDEQAVIFAADLNTFVNNTDVEKFCKWVYDQSFTLQKEKADFRIEDYGFKAWTTIDAEIAQKHNETGLVYVHIGDGHFMTKEEAKRWDNLRAFFNDVTVFSNPIADEDYVAATEVFGKNKAKVGQKVSRNISAICKSYGFDKIVEMRKIIRGGEAVDKDYGWNYYIAMFGDAINPLSITKYTVLSINPLDYWTMSFGKKWASCHTIDKHNTRRANGNHYNGCYCSGTESYMLDPSTAIFYTVDSNYVGEMWKADKDRRMNFHIARDGKSFCFGRLYPDGRDGGETGLAAQFRKIVQKILADSLEENNLWSAPLKGTSACDNYVDQDEDHTNYDDYFSYDDCGISAMKGTEPSVICVGHAPICPNCGREHSRQEHLNCERCYGDTKCEYCGDYFDPEDSEDCINTYDGHWFCCQECAEEAGYVYCYDVEDWCREEDCHQDDYNELWYYNTEGIECGERWYSSRRNAERDGWIELEDPDGNREWYDKDSLETDAYTGEFICEDWDGVFSPDNSHYYLNMENAIRDGWRPSKDELLRLFADGALDDVEMWVG